MARDPNKPSSLYSQGVIAAVNGCIDQTNPHYAYWDGVLAGLSLETTFQQKKVLQHTPDQVLDLRPLDQQPAEAISRACSLAWQLRLDEEIKPDRRRSASTGHEDPNWLDAQLMRAVASRGLSLFNPILA